jgi:lipoyl(octanoyl) transferase
MEYKTTKSLIQYSDAIEFMEKQIEKIHEDKAKEMVWFLEHPAIYTAGSSASDHELMNLDKFPVYLSGRGGKYTYHGPGQRVVYLMLDLRSRGQDIRKYVASLEDWIIASLAEIGLFSQKIEGKIGIWTKSKEGRDVKIAAIGIRVRKWIAYHGIAINVNPNLEHYKGIIPCGISDFGVTSLHELGYNSSMEDLDRILKEKLNDFL